jgi:hypothetical protein
MTMPRRVSTVVAVLLAVLVCLVARPGSARADEGIVAVQVTGPGAAGLRKKIVAGLPSGLSAANLEAGEKKAAKGVTNKNKKKRTKAAKGLAGAGRKAGHAAVVVATVKKKQVSLVVVDADSKEVLLDETVSVGEAPARVADALGPVAARFQAAEEPAIEIGGGEGEGEGGGGEEVAGGGEGEGEGGEGGEGEGGGGGEAEAKVAKGGGVAQGPMIEAGGGLSFGGRSLGYGGAVSGDLGDYSLFGALLLDVGAVVTPLPKKPGMLGRLGVTFGFHQSVGLDSSTAGGPSLATSWREWSLGARLRFGKPARHVAAGLAIGSTSFDIDAPDDGKLYPSASYTFLRLGGDGRMPIAMQGKLALRGELGVRIGLGTGGFADEFGEASTFGFDLGAGVGYRLTGSLEGRAGFSLARYGTSLSGGTTYMAESASDVYYGFSFGVVYAL